jgi:hypothetical protein
VRQTLPAVIEKSLAMDSVCVVDHLYDRAE